MKTQELRQILRKLIKEEVAAEVSKAMGKVLVEMVKEIKSNDRPTIVSERRDLVGQNIDYEPEATEMPVIHTKNPKLNSVLAETARNFTPNQKTIDAAALGLAALMEGGFDKIGQNESVGIEPPHSKLDFLKQMVNTGPASMSQPSALDGGVEVPDALKKVFKKDFRAVMKRIDEQKNGTASGGYIDPSKVIMNG